MRGDLTIQNTAPVLGLVKARRFDIDGPKIGGAEAGVAKRESERSFRISLNSATIRAIAGDNPAKKVPVRFVMSLNKNADGNQVYTMVEAGDRPAHGVISVRG